MAPVSVNYPCMALLSALMVLFIKVPVIYTGISMLNRAIRLQFHIITFYR